MSAFRALCGSALAVSALARTPSPVAWIPSDDGLPGLFRTYDSRPLRPGLLAAGLTQRFGWGEELVREGVFARSPDARAVAVQDPYEYACAFFLSAGLGGGFDFSLALPAYWEYLPGPVSPPDHWAAGDLSLTAKYGLPFGIPFVKSSLFARGTAPTATRDGPVLPRELAYQPYTGRLHGSLSHGAGLDVPLVGAGAGVSLDFSEAVAGPDLKMHANVSFDRPIAGDRENPLGLLAASLGMETGIGGAFRLEAELRQERLAARPGSLGDPLGRVTTLSLGAGVLAGSHLTLRLGGVSAPAAWNPYLPVVLTGTDQTSLRGGYRVRPPWAVFAQLAWQGFAFDRDGDKDGIPNAKDACPTLPEDRDGFQDEDGCPDPDNDHDGVPDVADACPYVSEDHDGFQNEDGCPEADNDRDAVPDSLDRCPNDPEDRDGYQDADGCPDLDDDRDGIPDVADHCPRVAENRNGVEDEDGCPEEDSDRDGIPDTRDRCPRSAEIINFYQDDDGCPDEKPEPIADAVLTGVEFIGNTAELDPSSSMVLDGLAARLFAYPGTDIEVQAYLDDRGGPRARELTQERAQAVVEYLANRGIEARRLKPVGYGASRPLAPNRTAKGRAANRRIQIHRLN